jgi:competence protein ComEC
MKALIIGDTAQISANTILSGALSVTGTSHIISVSGMNVAFLMGVLGLLIKNKRLLAAYGIPIVLLFMAVVGFMPPVTRAGIMQLFLLAAPLFKREADPVTSLSAALLAILLINPFSVGNIGLQLSFTATLGILLFTGKLYDAAFEVSLETSGALDVEPVDPRVSRVVDLKTPDSGEAK